MSHRRARMSGSGDRDRISALPDGVLQHVLGFLPAHEAVRTSVLAPRWRGLWRSMRRLHITTPGEEWCDSNEDDLRNLVNPLLLLRDHSSTLDEVNFDYDTYLRDDIGIWIQYALLCQTRVLIVDLAYKSKRLKAPLVSRHLKSLRLSGLELEGNVLNFWSCPTLEILDIVDCTIYHERILSQSVKHLRIVNCLFARQGRCRISIPSLFSLHLDSCRKAPLLEAMPSLQTAFVKICYDCGSVDYCGRGDAGECCGICPNCCGDDDYRGACVLLGGLPNVTNLELISCTGMFIFKRDMIWCPTFSKLKTFTGS